MILVFTLISVLFHGVTWAASPPLRILTDRPPETLNPRNALDTQGQRIGALLYRALTQLDENLVPRPDLASRFHSENQNRRWVFELGNAIAPDNLLRCFENYRAGEPRARITGGFSGWKSTHLESKTKLVFDLSEPDPYFDRNVSLLRYFETVSNPAQPCAEPQSADDLRFSGRFTIFKNTEKELILKSKVPSQTEIRFVFIPDETARTLALIRGHGDVAQNTLALTKTRWAQKNHPNSLRVMERDGTSVSYLAFNLKDPVLKNILVRKAITLALPTQSFVDGKMMGLGTVATQLLSAELPENTPIAPSAVDPKLAEELLEKAGYPRRNGIRFHLAYRTTHIREGVEIAKWIQFELKKIGIELDIHTVEPAVFLNSIRKGQFQLFSSRWIGVSDASILFRTLHSKQNLNRWNYRSEQMDHLLEKMMGEMDLTERKKLIQRVQEIIPMDLPFFPLFFWKNSAIVRKNWAGMDSKNLSLSGAYDPLLLLHHDAN